MDEQTLPGDVPGARMGNWCCAIAESTELVNWRRVGDVFVDGTYRLSCLKVEFVD